MAIITLNNNSLSSVTSLPAAISTGKVLQVVVGTTSTEASSSSATFADTNLTAAITPSATSSKILVKVDHPGIFVGASSQVGLKLFRGSTELDALRYMLDTNDTTRQHGSINFTFLDTPSSTSSLTYKTQFNNEQAADNVVMQKGNNFSTITLMEIEG